MLVGLALAGSLWFGLLPAFLQRRLLVANVDSGLLDAGMLALNAALLASFVTVRIYRRSGQPMGEESRVDDGTPSSGVPNSDEVSG